MAKSEDVAQLPTHGAAVLPAVKVDSYNLEIEDEDGFIGDKASKGAFWDILDKLRKHYEETNDEDPLGEKSSDEIGKKKLAAVLTEGDPEAAGLVHSAIEEFAQWGASSMVSTDDGSIGLAGQIPEIFDSYVCRYADEAEGAVVYTCGPEPMLRAVARICRERQLPGQACLERMMACGMGVCQSCVVRVRDQDDPQGWRYQLCCKDGPVFDTQEVLWED